MIGRLLGLVAAASLVFTNPAVNEAKPVVRISYKDIPLQPYVPPPPPPLEETIKVAAVKAPITFPVVGTMVKFEPMGTMKLGNYNAWYFDFHGEVPDAALVNFDTTMKKAWDRKLGIKDVSEATVKKAPELVKRYRENDKGFMSFEAFIKEAHIEAKRAQRGIDYKAFCKARGLVHKECDLLHDIAQKITGKDLIAYGMTELMPSYEGEINVGILRVLLGHAGAEYLHHWPALGDTMLSLGFYQFTSHAVQHGVNGANGGATKVSIHAKKAVRIPGSVSLLRGKDHHRAAFFFAVYNLSTLIKTSDSDQQKQLRKLYKKNMGEVAQFMAIAHHQPTPAIRGMKRWLDDEGRQPLIEYLGPALTKYAAKSKSNRAAVIEVLN